MADTEISRPLRRLRDMSIEEKWAFWETMATNLGLLSERTYHLSNAASFLGSTPQELALLSEVEDCNADGKRVYSEILYMIEGSEDPHEIRMLPKVLYNLGCLERQRAILDEWRARLEYTIQRVRAMSWPLYIEEDEVQSPSSTSTTTVVDDASTIDTNEDTTLTERT